MTVLPSRLFVLKRPFFLLIQNAFSGVLSFVSSSTHHMWQCLVQNVTRHLRCIDWTWKKDYKLNFFLSFISNTKIKSRIKLMNIYRRCKQVCEDKVLQIKVTINYFKTILQKHMWSSLELKRKPSKTTIIDDELKSLFDFYRPFSKILTIKTGQLLCSELRLQLCSLVWDFYSSFWQMPASSCHD